jgi:type IV pilus assembly protein PilC
MSLIRLPRAIPSAAGLVLPPRSHAFYTRKLAVLLRAGVPLVAALRLLLRQVLPRDGLFLLLESQIRHLEQGGTFSASLRLFPRVFDRMYEALVTTGEKSGSLAEVMERLALHLERSHTLRRKLRASLTYPMVVLVVALGIGAGMFFWVVPQFECLFEGLLKGAELPLLTRGVLGMSRVLKSHPMALISGGIMIWFLFRALLSREALRLGLDRMLLSMPVFGRWEQARQLSRFCATLALLMESAVPIMDAFATALRVPSNRQIRVILGSVRQNVGDGMGLGLSMTTQGQLPDDLVAMVEVGEHSGNVAGMLGHLARLYEEESERGLDALCSLVEPALMIWLAVGIGSMVVALFLPLVEVMRFMG